MKNRIVFAAFALLTVPLHAVDTLKICWAKWDPAVSLDKLAQDFTKTTGVAVTLDQIPWATFEQAAFDRLASKKENWDILIGDSQWLGRCVKEGYYVDLTEWVRKAGVDTNMTASSMTAYSEYPKGQKKYWSVPLEGDALAFAYRMDLFEDKGNKKAFKKLYGKELSPPETIEDLLNIAKFFADPKQRKNPGPDVKFYGLAGYGASSAWGLSQVVAALMWNFGGSLGDYITLQVEGHLDSPGSLQGIEAARELFKLYPPGFGSAFSAEVNAAYNAGLVPMQLNFMAFFPEVVADWAKFSKVTGFFAFPMAKAGKETNHCTALGGQGASVVSTSKHKDLAMKWLDWFVQEETQKKWAKLGGFTCDSRVLRSREFLDATPYNITLAISMGMARDIWSVPEYPKLMTRMEEILAPFVTQGTGTAQEVSHQLLGEHRKIFKAATGAK